MIEAMGQIVGLLSAFSSGRDAKKALDVAEFNTWLIEHKHAEAIKLLQTDTEASIFVKAYLNRSIPSIQEKLDKIADQVNELCEAIKDDEESFAPHKLLKGYLNILFARIVESDLSTSDIQQAIDHVESLTENEGPYNHYVMQSMVRECLARKKTVNEIIELHWFDLINT